MRARWNRPVPSSNSRAPRIDPSLGGALLLFTHAVWIYLHPALGGALVAAIGVTVHLLRGMDTPTRGARFGATLVGLALVIVVFVESLLRAARFRPTVTAD